jgi:hypothetical protein
VIKINITNITHVDDVMATDMDTDMDDEVYDGVAITTIGPPNLVDYFLSNNSIQPTIIFKI